MVNFCRWKSKNADRSYQQNHHVLFIEKLLKLITCHHQAKWTVFLAPKQRTVTEILQNLKKKNELQTKNRHFSADFCFVFDFRSIFFNFSFGKKNFLEKCLTKIWQIFNLNPKMVQQKKRRKKGKPQQFYEKQSHLNKHKINFPEK